MNEDLRMSVSSMTRTKDKKALYVLFQDDTRMAEFELPACRVVSNKGFSEDELKQLLDYVDGQREYIYSLGKKLNPIKAMMKD
ncbi:MAG: hypothetical protein IJ661_00620 [Lachnospiraceae bacterium]|nr:hypothetical protein [Lachnospiraceae bacterium]